jgi:hypothetical protein
MSTKHKPPRQDRRNVGRAPVKRHVGKQSAGTDKPAPNDFTNPDCRMTAGMQAGLFYSRAANRSGRQPL